MTCIAAVVGQDGRVVMGGDSAGVMDDFSVIVRADEKVFRRGEMLFGFTDSFRMGQLLRYSLKLPELPDNNNKLDKFMATKFINAVRRCLKKGGYATVDDNVEEGGFFLVAVRGRLYRVESDFQVGRAVSDFAALGCGEGEAAGVLYVTGKLGLGPRKRVKMALKAAEKLSGGVRGPFKVFELPSAAQATT